jgi:hypothetical protein
MEIIVYRKDSYIMIKINLNDYVSDQLSKNDIEISFNGEIYSLVKAQRSQKKTKAGKPESKFGGRITTYNGNKPSLKDILLADEEFAEDSKKDDSFVPVLKDGTINHGFMKGQRVKNTNTKDPNKEYEVIGLYQAHKGKNYNRLCFALRDLEDQSGEHVSSWWFSPRKTNSHIVFLDEKANAAYLSSNYSELDMTR